MSSSASPPVRIATMSTEKSIIARFGVTKPNGLGRTVFYVNEVVHLVQSVSGSDNGETLFYNHPHLGIRAVSGYVDEATYDLVYRLSYYASDPYNPRIGIRIAASDNPDYASKIVIYMKGDVDESAVCREIAEALYGNFAAVMIRHVDSEQPSAAEKEDFTEYIQIKKRG